MSDAEGGKKSHIEIMIAGKTGINKGCFPGQLYHPLSLLKTALLPAQPRVYWFLRMSLLSVR